MDGFGTRLKAFREACGLGAIDIARAAYADEKTAEETIVNFASYIGRLERGKSQNPKLDVLERLARGFGLADASTFLEQISNRHVGAKSAHKVLVTTQAAKGADDKNRTVPTLDLRELFLRIADVFHDAAELPHSAKSRSVASAGASKSGKR